MSTAYRLKANQCALDGVSTISNIIEIEKKNNAQFDHAHVEKKQDSEVIEDTDGKKMMLNFYNKAKEEINKFEKEHKNKRIWARVNIGLKHRSRYY